MGGRKRSELIPGSIPHCCQNGNFHRADSSPTQPLLDKRRFSSVDGVRSLNDRYHDRYSPFKRKSFKKRTEEFLSALSNNECKALCFSGQLSVFCQASTFFSFDGRLFLDILLVKRRVQFGGVVC